MKHLERAKKQLELGKPISMVKDSIKLHFLELDRQEFEAKLKAEYDELHLVNIEYIEVEVDDYGNEVEVVNTKQEYDLTAPTFEEYKNETRVVTEAVEATYDEDGMELTPAVPEVTEMVRPYIASDVSDKVAEHIADYESTIAINTAQAYLDSTDFYMTVDKYATLTDEKKAKLTQLREEAREVIRSYED